MQIVIVEDELRVRNGLINLIPKINEHYKVCGYAENGYEGIKVVRDHQPDLVISDIQMPKMDGLTMISQIKSMGLSPKFVLLSGYAEFQYAQQGIQLGVKEYLLKPITVAKLSQLLETLDEKEKSYTVGEAQYPPLIQAIIQFIDENYAQRLGLDVFAEEYHMTPEYISLMFTKKTGMTFSNYLKKVRIEHAKDLLIHSNMKVYEIACRVGYSDQKYFSKVFKEYTGVTPKQYALANAHRQKKDGSVHFS